MARILVAVDGSELGDRILSFLDRLPQPEAADVVLLRVIEQPDRAEAAVAHVNALADRLQESGVRANALLTLGDPAAQILRVVEMLRPSLVAMSTKGAGESEGWGSVALSVLERCPVPLLTGNPRSLPLDPGVGFAKILVPLDGTEYSARILPSVAAIAVQHRSEVVLLLVDPRAESADDVSADELAKFKQRLEQAGVSQVRLLARIGDEATEILDTVQKEAIDLLAMTSHSQPDRAKRYFGSVTEQVVKNCSCPLLLERIPAPE